LQKIPDFVVDALLRQSPALFDGSELLAPEAIRASPQAEQAPSIWSAGTSKRLTACSEPYNRLASLHASLMANEPASFD
jgi:hypothetical protein